MKIFDIKILILSIVAAIGLAACDETSEAGEFDNWQQRNEAFIDSIANVARTNSSGDWKIFVAEGLSDTISWENDYYVYCKVLQQGDGTTHPMSNDTILINYRGRLIPSKTYPEGYVFDQSYKGELDPATDVPVKLFLAGCIRGWRSAITNMVKGTTITSGDIWRIYIPAELGYGTVGQNTIPGHSALIFDVNLVNFTNIGTPMTNL